MKTTSKINTFLLLLCLFTGLVPSYLAAQSNPVVEELITFGELGIQEKWGHAARVVMQSAIEQSPRNQQAADIFTKAKSLADSQQIGNITLRISLLNSALKAHEKKMYRATKILLLELQRLEPDNKNVQALLDQVNRAIARGSLTYYQPTQFAQLPPNTSTTTSSTAEITPPLTASKIPHNTDSDTVAPRLHTQSSTIPTVSNESLLTSHTHPTTTVSKDTLQNKQSSSTINIPKPIPALDPLDSLPLKQRSEYEESLANSSTNTVANSFSNAVSPTTKNPTLTSANATATTKSAQSKTNSSTNNAKNASADRAILNPNNYPGYDHPYVIPVYQNTGLEKAEIDIITKWRDSVIIEKVIENGNNSSIQIKGKNYRIGETVLPEYYLFLSGLNAETHTLYFVDRRGNVFKKVY